MRVQLMALVLLTCTNAFAAPTAWNMKVRSTDGSETKLVVFGEQNHYKLLPACRCVAGMWQLTDETSTHFTGTLKAVSFNHGGAAKKSLTAKVRKTRDLMGAHRNYRAALLAIMRGSGQLILREVSGGEWEVVGYAAKPVGDLFATYPAWNAEDPQPARPAPILDPNVDANALATLINDYRASIKLPRIPISPALSKVAQAHVHDLNANKPGDRCNTHSWSTGGKWSGCCYDGSRAAQKCMWVKPKEIAGYRAPGYEIAASAAGIAPELALKQWQKSPAHHEVMTNKGIWNKPWAALGVAIEGDYAVAWFGEQPDATR